MHGGTSRNGRSYTLAVSGLYSSSWKSSFSNTTAPSLVATLLPTSKALSSVMLRWPCRISFSRFCTPAGDALALGLDRLLLRLGIEGKVVARRRGRHPLLDRKAQPGARLLVGLDGVGQAQQGARVEQVNRGGKRRDRIVAPGGVGKAPVGGGLDGRRPGATARWRRPDTVRAARATCPRDNEKCGVFHLPAGPRRIPIDWNDSSALLHP